MAISRVPWSMSSDVSFQYNRERILITQFRQNSLTKQWYFDIVWAGGAVRGIMLAGGINMLHIPTPVPFMIGINSSDGVDDPSPDNLEMYIVGEGAADES